MHCGQRNTISGNIEFMHGKWNLKYNAQKYSVSVVRVKYISPKKEQNTHLLSAAKQKFVL